MDNPPHRSANSTERPSGRSAVIQFPAVSLPCRYTPVSADSWCGQTLRAGSPPYRSNMPGSVGAPRFLNGSQGDTVETCRISASHPSILSYEARPAAPPTAADLSALHVNMAASTRPGAVIFHWPLEVRAPRQLASSSRRMSTSLSRRTSSCTIIHYSS